MKFRMLLLLPLAFALSAGQELLTNGDFEQDLSVGWTVDTAGYGYATFNRATGYEPDPDYEAMDSLYTGAAMARLAAGRRRARPEPAPFVPCCVRARPGFLDLLAGRGRRRSATSTPAATASARPAIYYHDANCTWTPTSTFSLIEVTDPSWNDYELNVADELGEHLPGVNPGDVSQVEVALLDTTAGG